MELAVFVSRLLFVDGKPVPEPNAIVESYVREHVVVPIDSAWFQELLTWPNCKDPQRTFVVSNVVLCSEAELRSADWISTRGRYNHRAAINDRHYNLKTSCPICGFGAMLLKAAVPVRFLFKRPIQALTTGEWVLRRDAVKVAVEGGIPLALMPVGTSEVQHVASVSEIPDHEFFVLYPLDSTEQATVLNGHARLFPKEVECEVGHTLQPWEDGFLTVRVPRTDSPYLFSDKWSGYAGGVWRARPYLLFSQRMYSVLYEVIKEAKVACAPVIVE